MTILGRKKEMIVSPDGLNVYPQDVERALLAEPEVADAAVVAFRDKVHAVLVLAPGGNAESAVTRANARLETYQRVKDFSIWPNRDLPRTPGTRKLKRTEVASWVAAGKLATPLISSGATSPLAEAIRKYAGSRIVDADTTIEGLGLSSLDRIQLLMELENRTGIALSETQFSQAKTVGDLVHLKPSAGSDEAEDIEFPSWSRSVFARTLRRLLLPSVIFPLARVFAHLQVSGLENLKDVRGPVIFASNHQSHFDLPCILYSLPLSRRYRLATAMSKEFFDPHFHPNRHSFGERFRSTLMYTLSCLLLNAFPLPQREAGARSSLRYTAELAGDGWSILIFPEGRRTDRGEIASFQPGVGMLAARLRLPVIPVRLSGLDLVLHKSAKFATPGNAGIVFGPALHFKGDDYVAIAREIEAAVRTLPEAQVKRV